MLPIARIREFLRRPDADIRSAAAEYFYEAHDCGEATFADWWAVVDALGFDAAQPLLRNLAELPDDDATLTRLFDELRKGVPARAWFSLRSRLERLPFAQIERRIDDLRAVGHLLAPGDLHHAEERLVLNSLPPEALWQQLMEHAEECQGRSAGGQDARLVFRLTDALARHRDFATPRTLAILRAETIEDWREIFAVELAGRLRCRDAIEPLIAKLRIDADYLLERARAALVRIGDPGIPALIAGDWEKETWNFRNFAHGAIASFRTEESAALLRDLIAREEHDDLQMFMTISLLEMLPDDAATLEAARQFVLTIPEDMGNEALDELLATVATMAGWDFPERAGWRALAITSEERLRDFTERDAKDGEALRAKLIEGLSEEEAREAVFGVPRRGPSGWLDDGDDYDDAPATPYVREAPKVGRNDPCPCNSGKKFKKCCGKAA